VPSLHQAALAAGAIEIAEPAMTPAVSATAASFFFIDINLIPPLKLWAA
jgi:hypothetical protein